MIALYISMYLQIGGTCWGIWWYLVTDNGIWTVICINSLLKSTYKYNIKSEEYLGFNKIWVRYVLHQTYFEKKTHRDSSYTFICSALQDTECICCWRKGRIVVIDILYDDGECCLGGLQFKYSFCQ